MTSAPFNLLNLRGAWDTMQEEKAKLDNKLDGLCWEIYEKVPKDLEVFKRRVFTSTSWLKSLMKYGDPCIISIHDPQIYGFQDVAHAAECFGFLKEAWKGIINVKVVQTMGIIGHSVEIIFTLP